LFTPFCSTGVDDRTAGFGAHPLSETMAPFSFDIARLKCSLAHYLNLLFISLVGACRVPHRYNRPTLRTSGVSAVPVRAKYKITKQSY